MFIKQRLPEQLFVHFFDLFFVVLLLLTTFSEDQTKLFPFRLSYLRLNAKIVLMFEYYKRKKFCYIFQELNHLIIA